jgi:hypothetical protein
MFTLRASRSVRAFAYETCNTWLQYGVIWIRFQSGENMIKTFFVYFISAPIERSSTYKRERLLRFAFNSCARFSPAGLHEMSHLLLQDYQINAVSVDADM